MEHLGCNKEGLKNLTKTTPHARPAGAGGASSISALLGLGYTKINPPVNTRIGDSMATVAIKNFNPPSADDLVISTESSQGAVAAASTFAAPSLSTSSFVAPSSSTVWSLTSHSTPTKNKSKVPIKVRSTNKVSRRKSSMIPRSGGGGNTTPRKTVSNGMSNRHPMPPVNLDDVHSIFIWSSFFKSYRGRA